MRSEAQYYRTILKGQTCEINEGRIASSASEINEGRIASSASEVTTIWRYTNVYIIIIIIFNVGTGRTPQP